MCYRANCASPDKFEKKRFAFLEYAHKSGAFLFVFKMGQKTGINISSRKEILNNFTKGFKNLVFIYKTVKLCFVLVVNLCSRRDVIVLNVKRYSAHVRKLCFRHCISFIVAIKGIEILIQ